MVYNTEKRTAVINFLKQHHSQAFSIDEIALSLSPDGSAKSTYYRLVSRLVSDGVLRKISDANTRHTTYQYLDGEHCDEHLHLKCKECGKLIHLDSETSHLVEQRIMSAGGFAIDEGALLFGKCADCKGDA